ncbi:MAG: malectin domain-containing carbohydrate-binding protein, partial [Armatimonadota bacterium]
DLGCTGLLGIHWRTKAMAFNVSALAQAGWDQSWKPTVAAKEAAMEDGPVGGAIVTYSNPVAGTDDQAVYQSVRYAVNGYNLRTPNGSYSVTLQFNEPHYSKAGARVFGTKLQGKTVIDTLDIFDKVGKDKALDYKFDDVKVVDGWLKVEFIYQIELPCIAGIVIESTSDTANGKYIRKINCGGPAYKDYEADLKPGANSLAKDRSMPIDAFYLDYARANFGDAVAKRAAAILAKVDGTRMPTPVTWTTGPGVVIAVDTPWAEVSKQYGFVTNLEALRKGVRGAGNLERFDYWLNTFRSMRAIAEFGCTAGELNKVMDAVSKETNPLTQASMINEKAIPIRMRMAKIWTDIIQLQVAAVDTAGEMGTIANLEQQSRKANGILTKHDAAIEKLLGQPLSAEMTPSQQYSGPARIIVPTVRSLVEPGESLRLKVIIIGEATDGKLPFGSLFWRPLGQGTYAQIPLRHVSRRVYETILPAQKGSSIIEYYIHAKCGNMNLVYPATAPGINQTVIVSAVK